MGFVGLPGEKIFRSPVTWAEMKCGKTAPSVGLKPLGEGLDGLCPEKPRTSSAPFSGTGCLRKVSPVEAPGRSISDCRALPLSVRKTRVLILLLIFNIKRLACFRSEPGRRFSSPALWALGLSNGEEDPLHFRGIVGVFCWVVFFFFKK